MADFLLVQENNNEHCTKVYPTYTKCKRKRARAGRHRVLLAVITSIVAVSQFSHLI